MTTQLKSLKSVSKQCAIQEIQEILNGSDLSKVARIYSNITGSSLAGVSEEKQELHAYDEAEFIQALSEIGELDIDVEFTHDEGGEPEINHWAELKDSDDVVIIDAFGFTTQEDAMEELFDKAVEAKLIEGVER